MRADLINVSEKSAQPAWLRQDLSEVDDLCSFVKPVRHRELGLIIVENCHDQRSRKNGGKVKPLVRTNDIRR
jgi:hypothetical protein